MKEKSKKDIAKGEFQHRMFKLIILIIAFVFICLIGGFIYITISNNSTSFKIKTKIIDVNFPTEESILESNEKYYKLISKVDLINSNLLNNTQTKICSENNFYKIQIYNHIPCISNNNITNLINKYFNMLSNEIYNIKNNNDNYFKIAKMDNMGRLCINNSDKKINILLAPISQIKYFNSYQKKSNSDIINIYLKNNIDDIKDVIYYEFNLDKFDYIYIPSYYFIQIKNNLDNFFCYEYQDISLFNDMVFKILYNQ